MTKEQADKHKDVIKWWLENTDKGVWCNYGYEWELGYTPKWEESFLYVQNDEYAELRMAQADGKVIEEYITSDSSNGYKDIWMEHPFNTFYVNSTYRIKPDEHTIPFLKMMVKPNPVERITREEALRVLDENIKLDNGYFIYKSVQRTFDYIEYLEANQKEM